MNSGITGEELASMAFISDAFIERWQKRNVCFAMQHPGKARQEYLPTYHLPSSLTISVLFVEMVFLRYLRQADTNVHTYFFL